MSTAGAAVHGHWVGRIAPVLALALAGCGIQEVGGGLGIDLPGLDVVYECDTTAIDVPELVELELCFDGGAAALEASLDAHGFDGSTCWPTDRHAGPCLYRCPSASGANANNGSWCP